MILKFKNKLNNFSSYRTTYLAQTGNDSKQNKIQY